MPLLIDGHPVNISYGRASVGSDPHDWICTQVRAQVSSTVVIISLAGVGELVLMFVMYAFIASFTEPRKIVSRPELCSTDSMLPLPSPARSQRQVGGGEPASERMCDGART